MKKNMKAYDFNLDNVSEVQSLIDRGVQLNYGTYEKLAEFALHRSVELPDYSTFELFVMNFFIMHRYYII